MAICHLQNIPIIKKISAKFLSRHMYMGFLPPGQNILFLFNRRRTKCSNPFCQKHRRHVCMQQTQQAQPVPVRQSYWRSVHRQSPERCADGYGRCPRFRVVYQRAYRTVFRMRISLRLVPKCCPGWKRISPHDAGCLKPVCENGCVGGICVGPNKCECKAGWMGPNCTKDVDECAGSHGCSQECLNQQGSYECACSDGFTLDSDMKSCKFCMSCTKEYREMQDSIGVLTRKVRSIEDVELHGADKRPVTTDTSDHQVMNDMAQSIGELQKKVNHLEKEKDMLMGNLTKMENNFKHAMDVMDEIKATTKPVTVTPSTTTTLDPYNPNLYAANPDVMPFDRIASLSEQISLLEERLEGCTCKEYEDYNPRGRRGDIPRG
ncbi:hypothetical protein LOTGIDRAFT_174250 [Lottia gigantea]|uniref:EMI domain-containing protein n=1 Tax=Lottia gigantea TaxID=225164 RepID=V4AMV7_LOTGI|nr:hypothetical protein LOTGIDRAFT_174250 [Lottia gigantea]ESO98482.1 hypothetical protein LOTGIDRAFT_174250 [Lottia gigantea]